MSKKERFGLGPELASYLRANSLRDDQVLADLRAETAQLAEGGMQVLAEQGQFLALLTRLAGARRVLEIGTFTGYSTLCFARAVGPEGSVTACDVSEEFTSVARRYWQQDGIADRIDLRIAPALDTLEQLLAKDGPDQYDLAFIDADKVNYARYYEAALTLVRPGGLVILDNTLWSGRVADPSVTDADTEAIRAVNALLATDERVDLSLLPLSDGVTLALKR